MPQEDFRTRLGREGLKSLMRDPRYLDGTLPEHKRVVATLARAFELVFDETPARPTDGGESGLGPFARTLEMRGVKEARVSRLPGTQRARLGRTVLLDALEADGIDLPQGLRDTEPGRNGPLARLGAAAGAQRPNAPPRPQAERPTTRRLVRTLLSDAEGRDDLAGDRGMNRVADRQLAHVPREDPDRDPTERARPRPKPRPFMLPPTHQQNRAFRDELLEFLRRSHIEGEVEFVYDDKVFPSRPFRPPETIVGNLTIGIGVKIDDEVEKWLQEIGADISKIIKGEETLEQGQREELAARAADRSARFLRNRFDTVLDTIDSHEWLALMSLAYNGPGLIGPGLTQAVRDGDVNTAVWEIACNTGGRRDRRDAEAAKFAGVDEDKFDHDAVCSSGRPK